MSAASLLPTLETQDTPALLLDVTRLDRNIARLRWLAVWRSEQKFVTAANILAVTLAFISIAGITQLLVKTSGSVITRGGWPLT